MTIIVLYILLGIIALIVILLHFSVRATIKASKQGAEIKVKWLFFTLYPRKPKKPKKSKKNKVYYLLSSQKNIIHPKIKITK